MGLRVSARALADCSAMTLRHYRTDQIEGFQITGISR